MPKPSLPIPIEVVARARAGDRAAHAEIYAALGGPVFTLARRMLASKAIAEDVLQETFVEVICNIDRFRGIKTLSWRPSRNVNLVLGGGDVGKTTILDVLALLLSPTNTIGTV